MRLILAHVVDFIHSYIFRHWPYGNTCVWVLNLWPDYDHSCRICDYLWPKEDQWLA